MKRDFLLFNFCHFKFLLKKNPITVDNKSFCSVFATSDDEIYISNGY